MRGDSINQIKKVVHEAIDQLYQARMNAAELLEEAENGLHRIPH